MLPEFLILSGGFIGTLAAIGAMAEALERLARRRRLRILCDDIRSRRPELIVTQERLTQDEIDRIRDAWVERRSATAPEAITFIGADPISLTDYAKR